jgi:hypothetical protein
VDFNTQVHGRNSRNLSVELSLSQTSKNAMSFLFTLKFSHHENQRRGQNRFCPERGQCCGEEEGGPNNIHTCK